MWIFLALVATGIILFKLGVLTVLVSVMGAALKATILILGILGIFMLYLQQGRK